MRIAVAGGIGTVGRFVASRLEHSGHDVVVLSRSRGVDVVTGSGLDLTGVDCVVDVLNVSTLSASTSRRFFGSTTRTLLAAARSAGVGHHLVLSIVGVDRAPYGYYAGKAEQERLVRQGPIPWTIQRTTQFFEFAEQRAVSLGPVVLLPKMRSQPVAADTVAERVVELVSTGPSGDVPDLAGPEAVRMAGVLSVALEARSDGRMVTEFAMPGKMGRMLRDGTLLPGPEAILRGPSVREWAQTAVSG